MKQAKTIYLIYDNDCPACRFYSKIVEVKKTFNLELINARKPHKLVDACEKKGLDLDEGFVLVVDDQFYYGPEAINHLSLISSKSGIFNKLNYWIFRSKWRSKWLYPLLKTGRDLLLKILRIKKIKAT